MKKKLTRFDLQQMKEKGEKAVWMTAYDFTTAMLAEKAGMDMLLVGDSLGMAVYGYPGTIPVTIEQSMYHTEAVRRGAPNTFVIGDMPFGSYHGSVNDAVQNAVQYHKKCGVDCIKLEGGTRVAHIIRAIADSGMLVMGHVGLTPQTRGPSAGSRPRAAPPRRRSPSWRTRRRSTRPAPFPCWWRPYRPRSPRSSPGAAHPHLRHRRGWTPTARS